MAHQSILLALVILLPGIGGCQAKPSNVGRSARPRSEVIERTSVRVTESKAKPRHLYCEI